MAIAITNRNEKIIESSTNAIFTNNILQNEYNNSVEDIEENNTNITKMLQK